MGTIPEVRRGVLFLRDKSQCSECVSVCVYPCVRVFWGSGAEERTEVLCTGMRACDCA